MPGAFQIATLYRSGGNLSRHPDADAAYNAWRNPCSGLKTPYTLNSKDPKSYSRTTMRDEHVRPEAQALFGFACGSLSPVHAIGLHPTYLWLAWHEGMERTMGTTTMGYIGNTMRIHSFIPN